MKSQSQSEVKGKWERQYCLVPLAKWPSVSERVYRTSLTLSRRPPLKSLEENKTISENEVNYVIAQLKEAVLISVMPFIKMLPKEKRHILFDAVRWLKLDFSHVPVKGEINKLKAKQGTEPHVYVYLMKERFEPSELVEQIETNDTLSIKEDMYDEQFLQTIS